MFVHVVKQDIRLRPDCHLGFYASFWSVPGVGWGGGGVSVSCTFTLIGLVQIV